MKVNLKQRTGEKTMLMNFNVYASDKEFLNELSATSGISLAHIFRSYINNLRDGIITLEV
jgi:hypothetical protein